MPIIGYRLLLQDFLEKVVYTLVADLSINKENTEPQTHACLVLVQFDQNISININKISISDEVIYHVCKNVY